jgi:protein-disulfide isomerase
VLGGALFGMIKLASYQSAVVVKAVTPDDWIQGDIQAPAVLVEYSDFQCPACAAYYPLTKRLQKELGPDKFLFVYRNFPLYQIHANARLAAQAAEAAGKQKKFWEMHDRLFETQQTWEEYDTNKAQNTFASYAESLKLNKDQFIKDLNSPEVKQAVEDDIQSGEAAKVDATPTFFLNGKKLPLVSNYEEFKKIIEQTISTPTSTQ